MTKKVLFFGAKLAVTCACFWYVFHRVNFAGLVEAGRDVQWQWFFLAAIILAAQLPLVGLRWAQIINALVPQLPPVSFSAVLAIFSIANFFAQVLPGVISDALRVWLLSQVRSDWRKSLTSVVIDRGVGVGALLAVGFISLLIPSSLAPASGFRLGALLTFATLLVGGAGLLVFARLYAPLLSLWPATKWIGGFILASRQVLIASPAAFAIAAIAVCVHVVSIVAIWMLGQGFAIVLSIGDAAVLFTLIVAVAIVPLSVSGWGLREVAVTAFLHGHGIPAQRALLFSGAFGLALIAAALPGAVVLLFYSARKAPSGSVAAS